jgi:lysophospholipase L1-like esterase
MFRSSVLRVRVALAVVLAALILPATADASHGRHWRVAWATAVDGLSAPSVWTAHPTGSGAPAPAQTTYRFIIRPTIDGRSIQLRFSNVPNGLLDPLAGTEPVTFGAVRVGVRKGSTGAAVGAGNNHHVTFDGARSITVQPGGIAITDPVKLRVRRLEDLVVSVYIPHTTEPPKHAQTYVTQYLTTAGAGDHTADADAAAFTDVQEPIYWLDGAFVYTRARRALVAIGDSITDGDQARVTNGVAQYPDDFGMDRPFPWPSRLAKRLGGTKGLADTAVINEGENGDLSAGGPISPGVLGRLRHDVLDLPGVTHVVVEIGTNDTGFGRDANTTITNLTSIAEVLHGAGLRVIGATLVPFGGSFVDEPPNNAVRTQVNEFIRTSPLFDGVLDIARIVGQPGDENRFEPGYDSGDHLHPNAAGYEAIADGLRLRLLRAPR